MIKRRYFARHEKQISVQLWLFIPLKALIKRAAYVIEKTQLLIQRWMFTEPEKGKSVSTLAEKQDQGRN